MQPRHYFKYLIFAFAITVAGCKKPERLLSDIKNGRLVTIKSNSGFYICADGHQGNKVVANRKLADDWEKFTIKFLENNQIALRAYNFNYLSYASDEDGLLVAHNQEINDRSTFTVIAADSGRIVLRNNLNKYVSVDATDDVRANKDSISQAGRFFINPVAVQKSSYFTFNQLIPLITGLVFIFISVIMFQYKEDKKLSIILLLIGGLCTRIFTALLNAHLNLWDEQFHALVAKNMIDNFLEPTLYKNPVLPYDSLSWTAGHVWLHKQPLFLWQMALSMKIFGVNVFAMRLPSVLMSTAVIFIIYRIGKLTINKTAGFYGALLFALARFTMEIAAGSYHTDHNDVAFLFYVSASVWAWVEYENAEGRRKKYFLILIGVFSGCAVLVKWLTGLLVFSGWGLSILLSKERRTQWINYGHLLISFVIAVAVFLPWQIYILNAFPALSRYEYAYNAQHFYKVMEGHGGDFWWHFNAAEDIYGISKFFILFCAVIFILSLKNKLYKIVILTYILFVYIFFGVAATKMVGFTYCISFLIYLAIGATVDRFFRVVILNPVYVSKKIYHVVYTTLIVGLISAFNLDIEKIQYEHTMWKKNNTSYLAIRLKANPVIKGLKDRLGNIKKYVIFNCKDDDVVPVMFFNDVAAAYNFSPERETLIELKNKGYKIAVFDDGKLLDYLTNDKDVVKVSAYWEKL